MEEARDLVAAFFATRTKRQLTEAAVHRKVSPVGIFDASDIGHSPHLEARGFWVTLGEGARARTMPGRFARTDADAFSTATRPQGPTNTPRGGGRLVHG